MKRLMLGIISLWILLLNGCTSKYLSEFQPNIKWGGRGIAVAVNPDNDKIVWVSAETGGLFLSTDGAKTWQHRNPFGTYYVMDIKYDPDNAKIMLAVTMDDYHAKRNGAIWRSTDAGKTWSRPPTAYPKSKVKRSTFSAFSISFMPDSDYVFVGHDCGLAISKDNGATWTHTDFGHSRYDFRSTIYPPNRVMSVLATKSGRVYVAGSKGIHYSDDKGASFTSSTQNLSFKELRYHNHLWAVSPYNDQHVFLADRLNRLHHSTNGGNTFSQTPDAPRGAYRTPFVKVVKETSNQPDVKKIRVYWGNGVYVYSRVFKVENTLTPEGQWTKIPPQHNDFADMAFKNDGTTPYLIVGDGGLQLTTDGGTTWKMIGSGKGGFNALQINEVVSQWVKGQRPHWDIYFGTMDNDLWASSDGGKTWPYYIRTEGQHIRVPRETINHADSKVSLFEASHNNTKGIMLMTDQHFLNRKKFPIAPDGDAKDDLDNQPYLFGKAKQYFQITINNDSTPNRRDFQVSTDNGQTWKIKLSTLEDVRRRPYFSGPPHNPVVYVARQRADWSPIIGKKWGLVRINNLLSSNPSLQFADGARFGSMGEHKTHFHFYPVFGVDPKNPDYLIFPELNSEKMKYSLDGGKTWHFDEALTKVVTDNGRYHFRVYNVPLVRVIEWDPDKPGHILIGTSHNGILRSIDNGKSWYKIPGTEEIFNISWIHYQQDGTVLVASYGRGLWKLDFGKVKSHHEQRVPPIVEAEPALQLKDPYNLSERAHESIRRYPLCKECQYLVVKYGQITDVKMTGDEVESVNVTGGIVRMITVEKEPLPLNVPVTVDLKWGDFSNQEAFTDLRNRRQPIRALILDGRTLKGIVFGREELPDDLGEPPVVRVICENMTGGDAQVVGGEDIRLVGRNFMPTYLSEVGVSIFLGDEVIHEWVHVNGEGKFDVALNAPMGLYDQHRFKVVQQTHMEVLNDYAPFIYTIREAFEEK